MKRQAEFDGLGAGIAIRAAEIGDSLAGFAGRRQRPGAGFAGLVAASGDAEDREQPIAHEFQHLAALRDDGGHLAVEIGVQQADEFFGRHAVCPRGESAHVGEPDGGLDPLGIAAMDLAGEDALARVMPDICVE